MDPLISNDNMLLDLSTDEMNALFPADVNMDLDDLLFSDTLDAFGDIQSPSAVTSKVASVPTIPTPHDSSLSAAVTQAEAVNGVPNTVCPGCTRTFSKSHKPPPYVHFTSRDGCVSRPLTCEACYKWLCRHFSGEHKKCNISLDKVASRCRLKLAQFVKSGWTPSLAMTKTTTVQTNAGAMSICHAPVAAPIAPPPPAPTTWTTRSSSHSSSSSVMSADSWSDSDVSMGSVTQAPAFASEVTTSPTVAPMHDPVMPVSVLRRRRDRNRSTKRSRDEAVAPRRVDKRMRAAAAATPVLPCRPRAAPYRFYVNSSTHAPVFDRTITVSEGSLPALCSGASALGVSSRHHQAPTISNHSNFGFAVHTPPNRSAAAAPPSAAAVQSLVIRFEEQQGVQSGEEGTSGEDGGEGGGKDGDGDGDGDAADDDDAAFAAAGVGLITTPTPAARPGRAARVFSMPLLDFWTKRQMRHGVLSHLELCFDLPSPLPVQLQPGQRVRVTVEAPPEILAHTPDACAEFWLVARTDVEDTPRGTVSVPVDEYNKLQRMGQLMQRVFDAARSQHGSLDGHNNEDLATALLHELERGGGAYDSAATSAHENKLLVNIARHLQLAGEHSSQQLKTASGQARQQWVVASHRREASDLLAQLAPGAVCQGILALMMLVERQKIELAKLMPALTGMKSRVWDTCRTTEGYTLAHIAASLGCTAVVERLRRLGADMEVVCCDGLVEDVQCAKAPQVSFATRARSLSVDSGDSLASGEYPESGTDADSVATCGYSHVAAPVRGALEGGRSTDAVVDALLQRSAGLQWGELPCAAPSVAVPSSTLTTLNAKMRDGKISDEDESMMWSLLAKGLDSENLRHCRGETGESYFTTPTTVVELEEEEGSCGRGATPRFSVMLVEMPTKALLVASTVALDDRCGLQSVATTAKLAVPSAAALVARFATAQQLCPDILHLDGVARGQNIQFSTGDALTMPQLALVVRLAQERCGSIDCVFLNLFQAEEGEKEGHVHTALSGCDAAKLASLSHVRFWITSGANAKAGDTEAMASAFYSALAAPDTSYKQALTQAQVETAVAGYCLHDGKLSVTHSPQLGATTCPAAQLGAKTSPAAQASCAVAGAERDADVATPSAPLAKASGHVMAEDYQSASVREQGKASVLHTAHGVADPGLLTVAACSHSDGKLMATGSQKGAQGGDPAGSSDVATATALPAAGTRCWADLSMLVGAHGCDRNPSVVKGVSVRTRPAAAGQLAAAVAALGARLALIMPVVMPAAGAAVHAPSALHQECAAQSVGGRKGELDGRSQE